MDQINFTVRLFFIENGLNGSRSIDSHSPSYESQLIRVFDDENKQRYFTPIMYVDLFGKANSIEISDIGKLAEDCSSIWKD